MSDISGSMVKRKMFNGASPLLFERARVLRKEMTHAELVLWGQLRQHPMGMKFRRQHPLGLYIVDFYCHKLKLVIEVDGKIHEQDIVKKNDENREKDLMQDGFTIIRFQNEEILKDVQTVIQKINLLITELSKNIRKDIQ